MKPINFGGMNLWVNLLIKSVVLISTIFINISCNEPQKRIDTWKLDKGLEELVWSDTFNTDKNFNNPYLKEIIFIDSLMRSIRIEECQNENFHVEEYLISCSSMERLMIDSNEYILFRVDISGSNLYHNLNFIYQKNLGVIAKHVYGSGYIKLISRYEHEINTIIDQRLFDEMLKSEILFPVPIPDTIRVFDINTIDE